MKPTKTSDLRSLTTKELLHQIADNEKALTDMQFNMAVGQLENPAAMRTVRRDIAKIKTILRERDLGLDR